MDALRRMQAYQAIISGQTTLQSGRVQVTEVPLEISVMEAKAELNKPEDEKPVLLDVREQDEFEFCRIPGAIHIPLSEMKLRQDEVPKDKPVLVYCHHGARSMQVVRYLRTRGWRQVTNVEGGIEAWSVEIDPSVPRY
ncbi:hypothetical protein GUITHDRAFT_155611 [Guillardia theta CCMP2712]|uniref:Rhodanese domain-containing protein n=1 Tax=Guillardia theta (strain CCMP2712) TaxID=905079 RepID=L1IGD6_GUITC|nr:hypothetical protein GUITHDRAFT_155611 [Guillardia theta CCMP2712]EKX34994.1 hypothetical protein GUITHDRAFT_155611 [Guillardia theta CCMP2712]|eukprot:XP_005821974.1 hypothetical protein GUITHDRAFT_155611 [Guillardia theta CCMP2712]